MALAGKGEKASPRATVHEGKSKVSNSRIELMCDVMG